MRFYRIAPLLFLLVIGKPAFPQGSNMVLFRYFELYGGIGTAHYFEEIGGASTRWPGFLDKIDNLRDFNLLSSRISQTSGMRYALTDYIEMLHGATKNNDWYCLIQYRLSYHLTRGSIYTPKGMIRKSRVMKLTDKWVRRQRGKE